MRVWCIVIAGLAACYSPQPIAGAPCAADLSCPTGQTCIAQICVLEGTGSNGDAPLLDDATIDGALDIDAPIDGTAAPRWQLVQTHGTLNKDLNFTSSGANHTIIVAIETKSNGGVAVVSDSASSLYQPIAGSRAIDQNAGLAVEFWYTQHANAGATKVNASGTNIEAIVMWEVANLAAGDPFERVAIVNNGPTIAAPQGALVATTEAGQFVASAIIVEHVVASMQAGPFTADQQTHGNGWSHLTDNAAPAGNYAPTWNAQTPGTFCASSVVFGL